MTPQIEIESLAAILTVAVVPLSAMWPPAARWLTNGRGRSGAIAVAALCALVGVLVARHLAGSPFGLALAAPLPQLAFLGLAHQLFVRTQGREPADVLLDASPSVTPDGLFVLTVVVGSIAPFLVLIAPR